MKLSVALVPCLLLVAALWTTQAQDPLAVPWSTRQGLLKSCIVDAVALNRAPQAIVAAYDSCHANLLRLYRNRGQTLLLSGYLAGMMECGRATASWQLGSLIGDVMRCVALTLG